jgi:hypothetical protein
VSRLVLLLVLLGALVACRGDRQGQAGSPSTSLPMSGAPISRVPPSAVPTQQGHRGDPTTRPSDPVSALGPRNPPNRYISSYVRLLDHGRRRAAMALWLDGASVPVAGTRISFEQEGHARPAGRSGMGMGTDAYRFIVAVPGRYRETNRSVAKPTTREVDFLLVRSTRHQAWRILAVQDQETASSEPLGDAPAKRRVAHPSRAADVNPGADGGPDGV